MVIGGLIKPLRKVALNETIEFAGGLSAQLLDKQQGQAVLRLIEAKRRLRAR